jgi:hypothetical protein
MISTTSKISIRPAVSSDVPQVAEMMRSVSDREHSVESVRAMTVDFAPGEFYAWLALAGEDPVGVTMLEPCILEHRGKETRAAHWRYLWVRPDQRKTGLYPRLVFTMLAAASDLDIDLVYGAIRRPEVAAGHLALGMQKVGDMRVLIKPLNPAALFSKFHSLGSVAVGLSAVPDFAYRQYLSMSHSSAGAAYTITDVPATQSQPNDIIPALRGLYAANLQRRLTREAFLKRFSFNSDGDEYRALAVYASGQVRAAIVYRTAVRGKDIRAAVIMELGYCSGDQKALRFGLVELQRRAIGLRCEVILSLNSAPVIQKVLREAGYFNSNETYVLMQKPSNPQTHPVADNLDDWYFTFSDHDAF